MRINALNLFIYGLLIVTITAKWACLMISIRFVLNLSWPQHIQSKVTGYVNM